LARPPVEEEGGEEEGAHEEAEGEEREGNGEEQEDSGQEEEEASQEHSWGQVPQMHEDQPAREAGSGGMDGDYADYDHLPDGDGEGNAKGEL